MNAKAKCPVPGCNFHFQLGIVGWERHVISRSLHPYWKPELVGHARVEAFRESFPEFFRFAISPPKSGNYPAVTPTVSLDERIEQTEKLLRSLYEESNRRLRNMHEMKRTKAG